MKSDDSACQAAQCMIIIVEIEAADAFCSPAGFIAHMGKNNSTAFVWLICTCGD